MKPALARAMIVLPILAAPWAGHASDDPRTAAGLVEACGHFLAEDDTDWHWAWCAGTLHGMHTFFQAVPPSAARACPPQDATVDRFADVVVGFAKRYPERLAEPAGEFAFAALAESFPCAGPGELDGLTPAARQVVVRGVQARLAELGYDVRPNGFLGPQTSAAIRTYRRDRGLEAGEQIDEALLQGLMLRSTPAVQSPAKPVTAKKPPRGSGRD